ncbi:MAG: HAD family hydrolase [Marinilabiliales bacterium]
MKNKLAIIFDFDETLVEESTTAFVESLGVDSDKFWDETNNQLMIQGWDPVPAYLYKLIELSNKSDKTKITQKRLASFGKKVVYKNEVKNFFPRIISYIKDNYSKWEIEFYIISSGIGEIIRNTEIAKYFKDIWASDFAYNNDGTIYFPKRVLSFTDKTRYIFQISKGMVGKDYENLPYVVNEKVSPEEYVIPIKNMIYIGDGMTDIPCFSMIKRFGGITIGVYDAQISTAYGKAVHFLKDKRVHGVFDADYSENADLYQAIIKSVDNICMPILDID